MSAARQSTKCGRSISLTCRSANRQARTKKSRKMKRTARMGNNQFAQLGQIQVVYFDKEFLEPIRHRARVSINADMENILVWREVHEEVPHGAKTAAQVASGERLFSRSVIRLCKRRAFVGAFASRPRLIRHGIQNATPVIARSDCPRQRPRRH